MNKISCNRNKVSFGYYPSAHNKSEKLYKTLSDLLDAMDKEKQAEIIKKANKVEKTKGLYKNLLSKMLLFFTVGSR